MGKDMEVKEILQQARATENSWLQSREPSWKSNPFEIKEIKDRRLFAGYEDQLKQLLLYVDKKKSVLVTGSIGIGKTTFLKFALEGLPENEFKHVYIEKAPDSMKDFFGDILESLTGTKPTNETVTNLFKSVVVKIVDFVNDGKKFIVVIDELGDAKTDVMRWIRTLYDASGISIITCGPPETHDLMVAKHFPLADRISNKIFLNGFSKDEVYDFINKRIRYACSESDFYGGKQGMCSNDRTVDCVGCLNPFTPDAIDELFSISDGTPRSLLKICDDAIQDAVRKGKNKIDIEDIIALLKSESKTLYETLTEMQKKLVILLHKEHLNSKTISEYLDAPIGSVLNQLNELLDKKAILRSGMPRNYEYKLTPALHRYLQRGI